MAATLATTYKPAAGLRVGDGLVRRPAAGPVAVDTVTGTSRAAASSADRICVFLTGTNPAGETIRTRRFFDLDEPVEVAR